MKARPLLLCWKKTQPDKLEGPDGSWGLFSQQLLPENGKKKKEKEKKKRRKIPTGKEEIPAREGQAGRWGRPDGGSACACQDRQ